MSEETGKIISLAEYRDKAVGVPDEPEIELCAITIQSSGRVTLWLSYDLTNNAQFNWLLSKVAEATGSIVDVKMNGFSA